MYQINGKNYYTSTLKLGQLRQLLNLAKDCIFPENFSTTDLIMILGDKIHTALAIILVEENALLKDKDVDALATEIEFTFDLDKTIEVIDDFFVQNYYASLLKKFNETIIKITKKMKESETL